MRLHTCHPRNRAFTLAELTIGMLVTALVMTALATFSLATAEAWKQGETTNPVGGGQTVAPIPIIGSLAAARLDNEIGSALCTGGYYPGTLTNSSGQQASLLLWKTDPTSTGYIDASELEVIEYNAANHAIYKYLPTASTVTPTYATFSGTAYIATFKSSATQTVLARNVDGMQFYVQTPTSKTQLPLVEYRLYFSRGGVNQTRYGAACLHSPSTPSGLTLN